MMTSHSVSEGERRRLSAWRSVGVFVKACCRATRPTELRWVEAILWHTNLCRQT